MIGRADIEGSKSEVDLNSCPPQASYPCGNFSGTSRRILSALKGSLGLDFSAHPSTGGVRQQNFSPYRLRKISVLSEFCLGHLRYCFTDVPPQPNSPSENVYGSWWRLVSATSPAKHAENSFLGPFPRTATANNAQSMIPLSLEINTRTNPRAIHVQPYK